MVVAAMRIQEIGITLKLIQFGQFPVGFVSIEVLRPKGPEPSRHVVLPDILASQEAATGFVGPAKLVKRALVVAAWATNFLGRTGPTATHANRVGRQRGRGQHPFHPHLVVPVIAEVIGKLIVDPPREIAQMNPAGIVGKVEAAGIRNPVLFAPELEAVQVSVFPVSSSRA